MSRPRWTPTPMVNGRCWQWQHEGFEYQVIGLNGTEQVRVYYRQAAEHKRSLVRLPGDIGDWCFGHSRDLNGRSTASVAEDIYRDITAPPRNSGSQQD